MASAHRYPKSKCYLAFFRDNEGKLRCKTTKQTDARLAQEIANGWEKVFRTKNVLDHIRTTFDRLAKEIDPEATVLTACALFL